MITRTVATRIATLTAAVTVSAVLAGCGSTTSPASSAPPAATSSGSAPVAQAHNQADIAFATDMIPHHAQAVSMSKLAAGHASSPQVKDLAARIEAEQQPEIDQMTGFLRAWNAPVPDTSTSGMSGTNQGDMSQNNMPGMDHGTGGGMPATDHGSGSGMPGMMSPRQMQQLDQAGGAAFDTMFLRMMIGHHQGAVTMSQTELAQGENADAKTLAQNIITAQRREITEMQAMLTHW